MKTVKDVEAQLENKLYGPLKELAVLPEGYRCSVRIHGESKKKKQTALFEKNWSPERDFIEIRLERTSDQPQPQPLQQAVQSVTTPHPISVPKSASAIDDLIRALDRAESRRGYEFVALKWFRDNALLAEGFSWADSDSARRNILRDAIDRRLILTNKVQNPKSPQFPVTAIRLNRLMPEVRAVLGNPDDQMNDFRPVPIRGEVLSATVLRDRR